MGDSEKIIGNWCSSKDRDTLVLSTKVRNQTCKSCTRNRNSLTLTACYHDPAGWSPNGWVHGLLLLMISLTVNKSLQRLVATQVLTSQ
jgi:aryl-alcohol dehydrogenase-like predicted oxidoreductase